MSYNKIHNDGQDGVKAQPWNNIKVKTVKTELLNFSDGAAGALNRYNKYQNFNATFANFNAGHDVGNVFFELIGKVCTLTLLPVNPGYASALSFKAKNEASILIPFTQLGAEIETALSGVLVADQVVTAPFIYTNESTNFTGVGLMIISKIDNIITLFKMGSAPPPSWSTTDNINILTATFCINL
jgi:hypothetical protein